MQTEFAVLESPQGKSYICRCKLFGSIFEAIDFISESSNPNELELLDLQTNDLDILEYTPHRIIG